MPFQVDFKLQKLRVFVKLINLLLDDNWLSPVLRVIPEFSGSLGIIDRPMKFIKIDRFGNNFAGLLVYVGESLLETVDIVVIKNVILFMVLLIDLYHLFCVDID